MPVQQQYEAVGHAVRAVYNYSGMADVAAETGDKDYQSAVLSLWDNMVNKNITSPAESAAAKPPKVLVPTIHWAIMRIVNPAPVAD